MCTIIEEAIPAIGNGTAGTDMFHNFWSQWHTKRKVKSDLTVDDSQSQSNIVRYEKVHDFALLWNNILYTIILKAEFPDLEMGLELWPPQKQWSTSSIY